MQLVCYSASNLQEKTSQQQSLSSLLARQAVSLLVSDWRSKFEPWPAEPLVDEDSLQHLTASDSKRLKPDPTTERFPKRKGISDKILTRLIWTARHSFLVSDLQRGLRGWSCQGPVTRLLKICTTFFLLLDFKKCES